MFGRRQGIRSIPARPLFTKDKSFIRLVAALITFSGILAGLAHPVAARTEPDRIDGNTYSGLDYGWSLTWDDTVWTSPSGQHSDGTEYVVLTTLGEPYASGRIDATNTFGGDVDACVSGWGEVLRNSGAFRHIKAIEVESGIDLTGGAAEGAYSLDMKSDDGLVDLVDYVQCRPLGDDANLILSLGTMKDYYEEALPLFADLVNGLSINDASPLSADQQSGDAKTGDRPTSDNEADREDSDLETTYTGVNFNWSVTWDGHIWTPFEGLENHVSGVDSFAISTIHPPVPIATVLFKSTTEYGGDIDSCAGDGANWLEGGGEAMTDITEADVDLPDVPSDGAVEAYRYTFVKENEMPVDFTSLQICFPLDSMGATLVVHVISPDSYYDEALPYLTALVNGISIDFS